MSSNIEWQAMLAQLEKIASDPSEPRERRQKARAALQKAERGSVIRGSNSRAWSDRNKNNYGAGDKHIGGTA